MQKSDYPKGSVSRLSIDSDVLRSNGLGDQVAGTSTSIFRQTTMAPACRCSSILSALPQAARCTPPGKPSSRTSWNDWTG